MQRRSLKLPVCVPLLRLRDALVEDRLRRHPERSPVMACGRVRTRRVHWSCGARGSRRHRHACGERARLLYRLSNFAVRPLKLFLVLLQPPEPSIKLLADHEQPDFLPGELLAVFIQVLRELHPVSLRLRARDRSLLTHVSGLPSRRAGCASLLELILELLIHLGHDRLVLADDRDHLLVELCFQSLRHLRCSSAI